MTSLEARFAARAPYLKYCEGRYYSHRRTAESLNLNYTHVLYQSKRYVQFWSCNKAVAYVFPHRVEPSSAIRTGQYLLNC